MRIQRMTDLKTATRDLVGGMEPRLLPATGNIRRRKWGRCIQMRTHV
jgi:hypothetical protein